MQIQGRHFSSRANDAIKKELADLLAHKDSPTDYQNSMLSIGNHLGQILATEIPTSEKCLILTTAEDADFLANGIIKSLSQKHTTTTAVFWNNHYQLSSGSVAPVVHKFLEPGFDKSDTLIVVKSVISGSCVVRTNILALIEQINVSSIYIVSPVIHSDAESNLRAEFSSDVSEKFKFVYLAKDDIKDASGEVEPGIGGQVYKLLGLGDQPARTSYIPSLVRSLVGN